MKQMTERESLVWASVAHVVLLGLLSFGLRQSLPSSMVPDVIPIEITEIGPVPTVTEEPKPSMDAAPQDPGPPPPTPEPTPEPAPEPLPAPEPVPAPKPDLARDEAPQDIVAEAPPKPRPEPKPKPKPKPQPKQEPKPKEAAPPKPAPQTKDRFDSGALASLIDKSLPKADRKPADISAFAKSIEQAIPKGPRISARQVSTLEQAIRAQIAPCWNPPTGGADVREMTVVLRIRLNRDGSLVGQPEFVSQTGRTAGNQAYAQAFVDAARRAAIRCAPLSLPADLYSYWQEFELNFDPRLMT